ncbi:MAG: hypothetical protein DRI26_01285 [Chloroflexi bacterium]|nr:MAG: hypothetical protein DRI26_01285 [Chloroflexota bacterium]
MPPHFTLDTEEQDDAAEAFWPEGFKQVVHETVQDFIARQFVRQGAFRETFASCYAGRYSDYKEFVSDIARIVAIGAENGADAMFDEIFEAFYNGSRLPEVRKRARLLWPAISLDRLEHKVRPVIVKEYAREKSFENVYVDHFKRDYDSFEEFLTSISKLVTVGAVSGADDALERVYRALLNRQALPPARRRARRLKI